jgi:AcrR family transcriptional regulator
MADVTARPNRREERRRQTHERIYRHAIRLFNEQGFERVKVNDIAEAAGVSVPTFYAHYASKDELLLALPSVRDIEGLIATQPAHLPVSDQVRGAIRTWVESYGAQDNEQILERWRIVAASPDLRVRAAEFERKTARMVFEAIEARSPEGARSSTAEVTVTAMLAAYTQILLRWAADGGEEPLADVAEQVLEDLRGI